MNREEGAKAMNELKEGMDELQKACTILMRVGNRILSSMEVIVKAAEVDAIERGIQDDD